MATLEQDFENKLQKDRFDYEMIMMNLENEFEMKVYMYEEK